MNKLNKHEDERGIFLELYKENEHDHFFVEQVSYLTINPGQTRGGHFHKKMMEEFILLKGSVTIETERPEGIFGSKELKNAGDSYATIPYLKHTLFSKDGCEMIILSNKAFNPDEPDTYREFDER